MNKVLNNKNQVECNVYGICRLNDRSAVIEALQQVTKFGLKVLSSSK